MKRSSPFLIALSFPIFAFWGQTVSAQNKNLQAYFEALEKPFYNAKACRTLDKAVWAYGWNFALLTALKCSNGSETIIRKLNQTVRQLERGVGVITPELFPTRENKVKTSVGAVIFFSKGDGYRLGQEISRKGGFRAGALFEFAIKNGLLMVLYSEKGNASNKSLFRAIKRSASVAGIPERLLAPLQKCIQDVSSYKVLKSTVFSLGSNVKSFLRGKETSLRPVSRGDQRLPAMVRDMVTPYLKNYPESKNPESKDSFKFRSNMFQFGIDLCLVSYQVAQGKDASTKLTKLKKICKIFGVKFPVFVGSRGIAFDDLESGTKTDRNLRATSFLIRGGGSQLARALGQKKGLGHASVAVEMGVKAFLSSRYQSIFKKHSARMDQEFERLGRKMHLPSRTIVKFQGIYREADSRKRAGIVIGLMKELKEMGAK
jgi:hypothetical protein